MQASLDIVDDIVAKVMRSAPASQLGSEFDEFLFAPIADDGNGMLLSVVSALARLDVDPWEEAAHLARMPPDTAIQRLGTLIAALPDGPSARSNPRTIAARLIALLPRRADSNLRSRELLLRMAATTHSETVKDLIFYAIFIVFVVSAQWIIASDQSPAVDNASEPGAAAVSSQMAPRNAAQ